MDHAWLDSLSEDWVSQPRSSGSPAPSLPSLPSLSNSTSDSSNPGANPSRIPKFDPEKRLWTTPSENPLSERSLNDHNIPHPQPSVRINSKLRDEITYDVRGRQLSRTLSASSAASTHFDTIQHRAASLSPRKSNYETPEWKRRLLQGEVAYGEQRDLFSPAGLENLFRPPPALESSVVAIGQNLDCDDHSIMPSSPPPYHREHGLQPNSSNTTRDDREAPSQPHSRQQPRSMKYNLVDDDEGSMISLNNSVTASGNQSLQTSYQKAQHSGSHSSTTQNAENQDTRAVSGQSDMRNEEFSPVYVARENSSGKMVDPAMAKDLEARLDQICDGSSISTNPYEQDLSENGVNQVADVIASGRFVNLRRGGYSHEGSFQKRLLSLSSLPAFDESAMLPEESIQASTPKTLPTVNKPRQSSSLASMQNDAAQVKTPDELQTPQTSPARSSGKNSAGSPLKLFGNYDTFTNQKLLRRLSQFEGDCRMQAMPSSVQDVSRPGTNDASNSVLWRSRASQPERQMENNPENITEFGKGTLDDFRFREEISYVSQSADLEHERVDTSLPVLDSETRNKFTFQLHASSAIDSGDLIHTQRVEDVQTPRKLTGEIESKRMPRSPLKDSTPKRRRTVPNVEEIQTLTGGIIDMTDHAGSAQQMQSIVGRKRKDARHGNDQQVAQPQVLAMRQILQPRKTTPSQRIKAYQEVASPPDIQDEHVAQAKRIAEIQAQLDQSDSHVSSLPVGVMQQMQNESRKGSVTTQDFLDEAKKIMAGIRGKARSGLASLEESESENDRLNSPKEDLAEQELEDSYQESTREPFSRPPSREGQPVERLQKEQHNPALLDHLRKYQEVSELDMVIASSVRSIAMVKEAASIAQEFNRITEETIARTSGKSREPYGTIESDPPNIVISENPDALRKRKHSTSSVIGGSEDHDGLEFPSHGSNASSGQSTTRSIPTGSSRGSDSRRIIAPHTVSHLIPEQVAGMYLDREKNIWIKRKPSEPSAVKSNFLPSDESEEDPFGDIPDLSVDETQEYRRLKAVAAREIEEALATQLHQYEDLQSFDIISSRASGERDATSGATMMYQHSRTAEGSVETSVKLVGEQDIDDEISIAEGRVPMDSPQRRRNVTISFSSPLEQVIQSNQDIVGSQRTATGNTILLSNKGSAQNAQNATIRSALRTSSRRMSFGGHLFSNRPVSRIDERDEDIASKQDENHRCRSVSIVMSTPISAKRVTSVVMATPKPAEHLGNLSLTPLSEFTLHQADQSFGLNVSYVEASQRYALGTNPKRTLSLSIKELVEKITQVEPYEPFWEHLQQLDLKDKRLTTLHKLDEFCEHLIGLDASHNHVTQLDGVPLSVRDLRITHNQLSDLAAWGHLTNLQYIDVSNNEIESLSGFRSLCHLRGLRADNNKIRSLDGISQLAGLLQLRLRGNKLESLDFSGSGLKRLTDLDVKDNKITHISNLHELQSLSNLNLEGNDLSEFTTTQNLRSLRYLKLSGNQLERLDISRYPDLRLLYVDGNRLESVQGLLKTKHLDTLSMREQQDDVYIDTSFLSQVLEVRKLFLSGNLLTTFQPQVEYLNLQYLELANCGLEALSPEFGYMVPNVRVLNLNFNALKDIRPLAGIARLKKLHLAGNRLMRLRTTTSLISQLQTLAFVDLRSNPFTQGFYPPISETRMVVHEVQDEEETTVQPFVLKDASSANDSKYASRLDQQTKMMRRLYEIMVLSGCSRLKTLDGLAVTRAVLTSRDTVWKALVSAGILRAEEDASDSRSAESVGDIKNEGTQKIPHTPLSKRMSKVTGKETGENTGVS